MTLLAALRQALFYTLCGRLCAALMLLQALLRHQCLTGQNQCCLVPVTVHFYKASLARRVTNRRRRASAALSKPHGIYGKQKSLCKQVFHCC